MVNQTIFDLADIWTARTGGWVRVVSANDHIHVKDSFHYRDEALDLWSSDDDSLADWFNGLGYTTFWQVPGHYGHVHVQEDFQ